MANRPARTITGQEAEELLNLKFNEVGKDFIIKALAATYDMEAKKIIPPKFMVYDKITIPKGRYCNNKEPINTYVGLLIFNKYLFEEELYPVMGYINETVDAKGVEKMDDKMSKALLDDTITPEMMGRYLDKFQWFFTISNVLSPSMTEKTASVLPEVEKKKEELFKKHKDDVDDPIVAANIEKELLNTASKVIGNDPGMDLYNSGAAASYSNNYKAMFVMKGPIRDTYNGEYKTVKSCYSEGIAKDELQPHFDSLVYGAYSKGVGTQVGGYLTKKFLAAFQTVVLDRKGSDCGTKMTLTITLTKKNAGLFLYMYIVENGKLVLLDESVMDKYIGKTVHMRLPLYCLGDKICNHCAGELYYKLGITNVGLTTSKMTGSLLQKSMKKFHDSSIKLSKISIDDLVID